MSELYKDKIEVSLDGRQVFYLFFGGAIIAGLVFVLGVMVGKRVEARAHLDHAATTAARDPLAALDRLATDGPNELSFREALTGGATPASDVDRQIAEIEKTRAQAAGTGAVVAPVKPEAKPADAAKPAEGKPGDKAAEPKPVEAKVDAKPGAKADPVPVASPSEVDPPRPAKASGKFTLQLSAFQDKGEAEAFLAEVKADGFEAYLTEASVPDKGTFFRVRLGNYPSYDDAVAAKTEFERKVKKIAYVSRI
jgi:cell division septation protein DedD